MRRALLSIILTFHFMAYSQEVFVIADNGQAFPLEVDHCLSLHQVFEQAEQLISKDSNIYCLQVNDIRVKSYTSSSNYNQYGRKYGITLSKELKKDISFIINTLGSASVPSLMKQKTSLQQAGDRIDHIHPLQFLEVIFTNEELKANAHALRKRTFFVWSEFFEGLKNALEVESNRNNLTTSQIDSFCQKVGISKNLIAKSLNNHQWESFFDLLLKHIPRKGNPGRYDF